MNGDLTSSIGDADDIRYSWLTAMTLLLIVALVLDIAMGWGIVTSRRERGVDRRHFAAYLGLNAAAIAVTSTTLGLINPDLPPIR